MASRGRRADPRRRAKWLGVLARHGRCGLSVRAFCAREGVAEWAFHFWRRKLRPRDDRGEDRPPMMSAADRPAFVPVVIGAHQDGVAAIAPAADALVRSAHAITIELRGGRVLRLPASLPASQLAAVIRVIEGAGRSGEAA